MRLGHSSAWELNWEKAIEFYRKALVEFPDDANALSSLGLALFETDQFKEALAIYHRAAKALPDDPIPIERCAEIFERLGQNEDAVTQRNRAAEKYLKRKDALKAIENWVHIARLEPMDLNTRSRLALTYERTGRPRESVQEYIAVAAILQAAGKSERAAEALQRALRLVPGEPEATQALRLLQEGRTLPPPSQPRGATAPLRMSKVQEYLQTDALEGKADHTELADPEITAQQQALTMLAGLLFDEPGEDGDEDEEALSMSDLTSGRIFDRRKSIGQPQMYRYLGQAIDLQTRGHDQQAVKEYERAMKAGLDHPGAHFNLGLLYKKSEAYEEARKHLSAALGHPELDLGANLALGRMARMTGDLPEAARHLLQALRLADSLSVDESQSAALNEFYDSMMASQEEGDEEELSQIVENTLNFLSGPDWLVRLREARLQLESQHTDQAVMPILGIIEVGGSERVLQSINRIDDYVAEGLLTVAMEEAMLALNQAPLYPGLHTRMAELMIKNGDQEAGVQKLLILGETHRARGEIQAAVDTYHRILDEAPVNVTARNRLIDLLLQQDRTEQAVNQYMELNELYRQMAEIDAAREALASALRLAQEASIGRAKMLKMLHQMGDIDLSRLDWRRALRVYEQISDLDPHDEKARSNVIDLNLRLGQEDQAADELDKYLDLLVAENRGEEALSLLEDLAREHPGKRALHARLAEAYRAAGRTADAIAQYDALGEIQLDAGLKEDAVKTIETIIQLNPPDMEGYEELLRNLKGD
jgi:tetratricopeptide (TPR) repeat protein